MRWIEEAAHGLEPLRREQLGRALLRIYLNAGNTCPGIFMNLETSMAKVTVEVELDLTELEDDTIIDELESRGYEVSSDFEADYPIIDMDLMRQLHELIRNGRDAEAVQLMSSRLRDILGKAL